MDGEDYLDRVLRLGGLQKRRRSYINGSHINNSAGVDVITTASKSHDQAESGHRNHYAACGNHEEAQSSHRNDYAASAGDHDKAESRHRNHHSGVRVGDYEEADMDAAATAEIGRGNGDEQMGEGMNVVVADAEIRPEVQQAVITQEGQEMRRHLVHWVDTDPYGRIQMHKRPRPGPKKTSNTYKGVAEYRRNSKWEAYIWLHDDEKLKVMGVFKRPRVEIRAGEKQRNQLPLGTWCSPEKAARTYDRAVLKLRKETENFHPRMYVHELHKDGKCKKSRSSSSRRQ
ncbi:hypothetical protein O6H91_11G107600 [Diphasiastrum complanatum]|uniref:Uncharacterized protein n=1 Tax=Diphasiastrum complanatum TaxID=34168 RepID=A0ACC2CCY3_DIPCM|nr:hypothetical protein O6H91_11G107600 [Diphasiastrum complanatum]